MAIAILPDPFPSINARWRNDAVR